ncbi:probable glutathione S-transferase [Cajanus cajan]|uniref:glutathione transferase n=1 Tax=Cajanus cajan TaxID=3821 RepID=A0A151SMG6_CAJCA|nr:probable glutathione S-transferase [Cajanus cajan]KYP55975.1 putative glutathione S-transferase [Cajanus cajan]
MAKDYGEVKFFGTVGSPFAKRVQIALDLKGVQYTYFEEDLRNKSELLLKYNPIHKKVPVLVHKGRPLAESLVILEYIDEIWGSNHPLLPQQPYDKALARFWSRFIDDKCLPAILKAAFTANKEEREKGSEESLEALEYLENELKDKFFGGESIGLVDIAASYLAFWLPAIEEAVGLKLLTSDKFPKLHKWGQEFTNHPVVKKTLPQREKVVGFFKARYASIIAASK